MSAEEVIEQIERDRRERVRRFDAAPSSIIEAFVGASAPCGHGFNDDFSLGISCPRWRTAGGSPEEGMLYIHHPIKREEFDEYRVLLKPWTQFRFRVRIDPVNSVFRGVPRTDARGEKLIDSRLDDPEFSRIIHGLQQPVVVRHPKLGKLVLDRQMGYFEGTRRVWFRTYSIDIQATPEDTCDLDALWGAVQFVESNIDFVLEAIADELIEAYEGWDCPIGPLSRDAFKAKPRLASLSVDSAGTELYFKDGGLFLGHFLRVHITDGNVDGVALEG